MAFAALTKLLNPPLYIVTADDGHERGGCLVGFATQCSIYPSRFLVCLSVLNHTARVASGASALAVHLLSDAEHDLAAHFGGLTGDETDKFAGVAWHRGALGAPVLEAVEAMFEGTVLERHELGDHVGYILQPADTEGAVDRRPGSDSADQLRLRDADDVAAGHPPGELHDR